MACVVGIANNNPLVDLENIDELACLAALPGSTYAVINAEGTPQELCSGTIPDFSGKGYTKAMVERVEASVWADIQEKIATAAPRSPEVDIAAASALAVRTLRANAAEGREDLLVCYFSGISTSGLVDMTAVPVCELDVEASAKQLAELLNLDMSGIDVLMYCCGDVAGDDQPPLSIQEQEKLKEFYRQLFTNLEADSVRFMDDIPGNGSYCFDQQVAVMRTEETVSGLQASVVSCGGFGGAKRGRRFWKAPSRRETSWNSTRLPSGSARIPPSSPMPTRRGRPSPTSSTTCAPIRTLSCWSVERRPPPAVRHPPLPFRKSGRRPSGSFFWTPALTAAGYISSAADTAPCSMFPTVGRTGLWTSASRPGTAR